MDDLHQAPSQNDSDYLAADLFALLFRQESAVGAEMQRDVAAVSPQDVSRHLRILHTGVRPVDPDHWRTIWQALIARKQLRILYHGRSREDLSERVVSPQRMVCYRGNWYLDAWCHLRQSLRQFSLECLHPIEVSEAAARDLDDAQLDAHFASAYGIFSGVPTMTAVLRFSPDAARWVADEYWHPGQQCKVLPDGCCELRVPYSNPRELVMDILKHGPDVEVLEPVELRHRIARLAARTAALYRRRVGGPS